MIINGEKKEKLINSPIWEICMDTIYRTFYKQRVFSMDEVRRLYKNYQVAKNALQRLLKQQQIRKIKAGLYCIIPIDDPNYLPDGILMGSRLRKKYFLSHMTALQLRALYDSKTVHVSTTKAGEFHYYGKHFRFHNTRGFFGIETIHHGPIKIQVSDRERTFLDCLDKPELFKDITDMLLAFQAGKLDVPKVLKYLRAYKKKKLWHYAGYALDMLQEALHISDKDLEKIEKQLGKKIYYLVPKKTRVMRLRERLTRDRPRYVKRWRLMVQGPLTGEDLEQAAGQNI